MRALVRPLLLLPVLLVPAPGRGPVTDMAGLRRMRDFLNDLRVEVQKAVKQGLSRREAARAVTLPGYPDIKPTFRSLANDVLAIYDEMRAGR